MESLWSPFLDAIVALCKAISSSDGLRSSMYSKSFNAVSYFSSIMYNSLCRRSNPWQLGC